MQQCARARQREKQKIAVEKAGRKARKKEKNKTKTSKAKKSSKKSKQRVCICIERYLLVPLELQKVSVFACIDTLDRNANDARSLHPKALSRLNANA